MSARLLRVPGAVLLTIGLLLASCSGGDGSSADDTPTAEAAPVASTTAGPPEVINPFPEPPAAPEFVDIRDADTDRGIPASDIENAVGSVGFSRYVYSSLEGDGRGLRAHLRRAGNVRGLLFAASVHDR